MPDWSSPLLLRGLAAAGALALFVSVGYVLATSHDGTASHSAAAGQGANREPAARPAPNSEHQEGEANVGAVEPVSVPYRQNGIFLYTTAMSSSTDYTSADLAGSVRKIVASSAGVTFGSSSEPEPTANAPDRSSSARRSIGHFSIHQLAACLSTVAGGRPVLLADVAHYRGSPAVIVILKPVSHTYDVVVAGLGCGAGGGDIITRLSVPGE
jgi:hypothetical protein